MNQNNRKLFRRIFYSLGTISIGFSIVFFIYGSIKLARISNAPKIEPNIGGVTIVEPDEKMSTDIFNLSIVMIILAIPLFYLANKMLSPDTPVTPEESIDLPFPKGTFIDENQEYQINFDKDKHEVYKCEFIDNKNNYSLVLKNPEISEEKDIYKYSFKNNNYLYQVIYKPSNTENINLYIFDINENEKILAISMKR